MRIQCRSLVGAFVLTLLMSGLVLAAEPASPVGDEPVVVSGTLECAVEDASGEAGDATVNVHHWTASDARLEGDVSYTGRWQLYEPPAEDSGVPAAADQEAAVYSIVNEGGSWLCEESRVSDPPRTSGDRHTLVFDGQGEYEGLTAYLQVDFSQSPYVFSGLILPGEEPPYAEPQG